MWYYNHPSFSVISFEFGKTCTLNSLVVPWETILESLWEKATTVFGPKRRHIANKGRVPSDLARDLQRLGYTAQCMHREDCTEEAVWLHQGEVVLPECFFMNCPQNFAREHLWNVLFTRWLNLGQDAWLPALASPSKSSNVRQLI